MEEEESAGSDTDDASVTDDGDDSGGGDKDKVNEPPRNHDSVREPSYTQNCRNSYGGS